MLCSRSSLAIVLSLGLIGPALSSAAATPQPPLSGDQRILYALNRFTFGPRPSDLVRVRAFGLDRWFDQQLHPQSLDESVLNVRLAQFPAMQETSVQLLTRLPSNAVLRQAMDGKLPIPPTDPEHAIYENQIYRLQLKREAQQQPTAATVPVAVTPADPALLASVITLPPQQRVSHLIALPPEELDLLFRGPHRAAVFANLSPTQHETVAALENPQRVVTEELIAQRLTRDLYSNAQLQEVMTDFWLNHFNVFLHKNEQTPYYLVAYERDVIRPNALGKFEDLLEATAHSPAMLLYLDNATSVGPDSPAAVRARDNAVRNPANRKAPEGLNENYARELMELHTLGVNGGYTQTDVTQVARILTGWTIDRPVRGGDFRFDPARHEPGPKKVLGKNFRSDNPTSGEQEGRALLHLLATRPATARFISLKLAIRFVSDNPPQPLVNRMAKSYLSSHGDIATVLRTLFHSPEFWATQAVHAKVKTPIEFIASAVRASDASVDNLQSLANALRDLGMPLYGAAPPTGFKWDAADWVSTGALVTRMNFALALAADRLPGITVNWSAQINPNDLPPDIVNNPEAEERRLESLLLATPVSDSTRTAVLQQFATQSAPQTGHQPTPQIIPIATRSSAATAHFSPSALEREDQILAGLLIGSPEFQRR
jgi:uncharacterized protein (DUF1800 family)